MTATRSLNKDRAAEDDLTGIWVYSFEQWGEEQADGYLATLEQGINSICQHPGRGCDQGELRVGYFSKLVGMHIVYYTFDDSEVRFDVCCTVRWTRIGIFETRPYVAK